MGIRSILRLAALMLATQGNPLATFSVPIPYAHPKSYFESRVDLSEPERLRIQKHLAQVEADLRAHPPAGLSAAQSEARRQRLDDLRAYRLRGEFPRNRDYPDSLVPYFIDADGVACAVGHLVIASGHGDFAEFIRRTQNHAYIREIHDPRLAEWAEASGLTLEECARIQPGYGGPVTYPYIRELAVGSDGMVWAQAGQSCLCTMSFQTFSLHPGGAWSAPIPQYLNHTMLCLDPQGRPMVGVQGSGIPGGAIWDGRLATGVEDAGHNDCAWSMDGSMAFIAGNTGLRAYRLSGSDLAPTVPSAPRETMLVVAAGPHLLWSGSNRGAFVRPLPSSSALTLLDSAGKATFRVTGLEGSGTNSVWAGINGSLGKSRSESSTPTGGVPVFSREGLLFRRGPTGGWTLHTRASAGLPSDTIQALAPADSQSVWIATAGGIYRFTPPGTVTQVRPAFNVPVTDLATDSLGRLYIGTWGLGVHRWHEGTTQDLGYYTHPSSLLRAGRDAEPGRFHRQHHGSEGGAPLRSLLGRRTQPSHGPGFYVLRAEDL